jgi:hypothetical protein
MTEIVHPSEQPERQFRFKHIQNINRDGFVVVGKSVESQSKSSAAIEVRVVFGKTAITMLYDTYLNDDNQQKFELEGVYDLGEEINPSCHTAKITLERYLVWMILKISGRLEE